MSLACATLRSQGYAGAALWVLATDTRRARLFYESLGWRRDGTIRPFEAESPLRNGEGGWTTSAIGRPCDPPPALGATRRPLYSMPYR